ncbi:transketolase [Phyllobacterium sp. SB3]|uniref:transketolase n=1 Tax=Phyllobacterium sp. SB3 TaxID=3156073 RepID=UPI0032B00FBC
MVHSQNNHAGIANDFSFLADRAAWVRRCVVDLAAIAGSGHIGPALSCSDVLVNLYYGYMNIDPKDPQKIDRDRFILSKGHACSALYPILADLGYFPIDELNDFTQLHSILGDHPNMLKVPGIDFSSGSLGHGLAVGIGMAEAARFRKTGERVIVMLGDGELNEGQIWEAAGYASARNLGSLLAIVDKNQVQVDGNTADVLNFEPLNKKFVAFGWHVEEVDGHEFAELQSALERFDSRRAAADAAPTVIIADTVSGKGIPFIEGMAEWHIGYLAGTDYDRAIDGINAVHAKG